MWKARGQLALARAEKVNVSVCRREDQGGNQEREWRRFGHRCLTVALSSQRAAARGAYNNRSSASDSQCILLNRINEELPGYTCRPCAAQVSAHQENASRTYGERARASQIAQGRETTPVGHGEGTLVIGQGVDQGERGADAIQSHIAFSNSRRSRKPVKTGGTAEAFS